MHCIQENFLRFTNIYTHFALNVSHLFEYYSSFRKITNYYQNPCIPDTANRIYVNRFSPVSFSYLWCFENLFTGRYVISKVIKIFNSVLLTNMIKNELNESFDCLCSWQVARKPPICKFISLFAFCDSCFSFQIFMLLFLQATARYFLAQTWIFFSFF